MQTQTNDRKHKAYALPVHPPIPAWQGKIEWNGDQAEMQVQNSKDANLKHRLKVESRRHTIEQLLNSLWTGDTLPFK